MVENNAQTVPPTPPAPDNPFAPKEKVEAEPDRAHMPMGEEFDKAKWTLPPWQPVVVALAIVLVVVIGFAFLTKAKPVAAGGIEDVVAVTAPPGDNVLAAVNIKLRNTTEKPLWVHSLKATIKTDRGEFSDEAANAADFERYYQGFPDLKQHAQAPLMTETKIQPGGEAGGTLIFGFPVTKDEFDKRKSITVTVQPYDRPAVVLIK